MAIDSQVQRVLDLVKQAGLLEIWQLSPEEGREQYRMRVSRLALKEPIFQVHDRRIPGPAQEIGVRIYQPREAKPSEKFPVLMWCHGGGFVIGDLDTHDSACRVLANQADCVVVAVDYRLAPECKFPAAVDDCHAALRWLALHAVEINADPQRIAVGGDSAGGNLAAVMALLARNDGHPKLCGQLLIYPCVAPEPETPSHKKFAEGYVLTRNAMTWFYKQYTHSPKEFYDFRFAPLVADDLSELPPALVVVAGFDPLRDEGVDYAKRLVDAGNRVTLSNYEGMIHGFYLMGGAVDGAKRALAESASHLRAWFARQDAL
ncbi:MAG: alpha/beta hydrolase [Betaproteobacteria bacterium]|nr:alpha/beta hydrolase [Betaproteobacteria bacterium]